ncbi:trypsin-like peptidase domain-containing protein [Streptomyces sp. NPDC049590]|uniref:trypsin-like peptidase domain-containing protein n=1 Tax=Streptomyces sp. NPDC049590 TaxID=3154834 RepID=UPI00341F7AEE
MNRLDLLLVVVAVCCAVSGHRRGPAAGCVPPAWCEGGAVGGVWPPPGATGRAAPRPRGRPGRGPLRAADGVGGAVAVLVTASLAAGVLVTAPSGTPAAQGRDWSPRAASALPGAGSSGVSGPFASGAAARPADDGVSPAAARAARRGTVKIEGSAGAEGREGSGFVYASRRVLTNAHVVAGIDRPGVRVGGAGRPYPARVVFFDPARDVAVLYVPGLRAPALRFAPDAGRGDPAVVAGYPQDGDLALRAATLADRVRAASPDIYDERTVVRDVWTIRSEVLPGDSGAPLLTPDGRVAGVVFARSVSDAGTGYALTVAEVVGAARRAATATARVDTGELVAA